MNTLSDQGRSVKAVLVILLIAILLDKFLIAPAAPSLAGLAAIDPMLVILDIPIGLPFVCGLIPVALIFIFLYGILILPYHSLQNGYAWRMVRARLWTVGTGIIAVPVCVAAGGLIYQVFQDRLPRHIRNAIASFGINMDIYSAIPGYEKIRLRGSMVMLVCFLIGLYIFSKRVRVPGLSRAPKPSDTIVETMPVAENDTAIPYPPLHTRPAR
ncbi:MAG TPA: hypothetical protein VK563_22560 [Puia sp.]|nr:hypothetical protein [Puia sp.]